MLLQTIHGEQGEAIEIPPEVAAAGAAVGDVVAREGGAGVEVVVQAGEEGVSWRRSMIGCLSFVGSSGVGWWPFCRRTDCLFVS